jgi:hypothetical protein
LISGGGCGGSAGPNQSQSCDNLATFHHQQSSQHNPQQQPFSSPNLRLELEGIRGEYPRKYFKPINNYRMNFSISID